MYVFFLCLLIAHKSDSECFDKCSKLLFIQCMYVFCVFWSHINQTLSECFDKCSKCERHWPIRVLIQRYLEIEYALFFLFIRIQFLHIIICYYHVTCKVSIQFNSEFGCFIQKYMEVIMYHQMIKSYNLPSLLISKVQDRETSLYKAWLICFTSFRIWYNLACNPIFLHIKMN